MKDPQPVPIKKRKLISYACYPFDFSQLVQDDKNLRFGMVVVTLLSSIIFTAWGVVNLFGNLSIGLFPFSSTILFFMPVCHMIGLVICIRFFIEYFIFFYNCIMMGCMVILYFFNPTKDNCIIFSGEIAFVCLCPLLSLIFSKKRFMKYFFFFLYVFVIIFSIPYEMIFIDYSRVYISFEGRRIFAILGVYTVMFVPPIMIFGCFFLVMEKRKRERHYVLEIAKAVSQLDVNSKSLKKLRDKNEARCSELEKLFRKILWEILEYSKYLPESLKMGENEENEVVSDAGSQNQEQEDEDLIFNEDEGYIEGFSSLTKIGMKKKEISYMIVDVKEFHCLVYGSEMMENTPQKEQEKNVEKASLEFQKITYILSRKVKKHKGVMESILGDKLVVSFNAISNVVDHSVSAVNCVMEFMRVIKDYKMKVNIFITSGDCFVGNLGSHFMKRFCHVSPMVKFCFLMKNILRCECSNDCCKEMWRNENECFVCNVTFDSNVKFLFESVQVESVDFLDVVVKVYKVLKKKEMKMEEWNYQLNQSLLHKDIENSIPVMWKKMWKCIDSKEYGKALEFSEEIESQSKTVEICMVKRKIKKKQN